MAGFQLDIRFALRQMRLNPMVTLVVVLTIALGIGVNSATFDIAYTVLLRPFPYKDPDRLVQIWGQMLNRNIPFHFVPYPDFHEWRIQNRSFEAISAYRPGSVNLTQQGEPQRLSNMMVNAGFFSMLGVPLFQGRDFLLEDDRPGGQPVAILSYELWQRILGSDANSIGRSLMLDGRGYTVVGILPAGFRFLNNPVELFIPLAAPVSRDPQGMGTSVGAYARLKPGVSLRQAQQDMDAVNKRLDDQFRVSQPRSARVWGVREFLVRDVRLSLWLLMGAVSLVLLIACANVASILLARSVVRRKELAIRSAIGAGGRRILQQLLLEALIHSFAGGALGVWIAYGGLSLLLRAGNFPLPLLDRPSLSGTLLGFTLMISLFAGVLLAIFPILATRGYLNGESMRESLQEGAHGASSGRASHRVQSVLLVGQVGLSLMLLLGAVLLIRSFIRLHQVDPGFKSEGVLTAQISLPQERYPTQQKRQAFLDELLQKMLLLPGVKSAGLIDLLPLSGSNRGISVFPEGQPAAAPGSNPITWVRNISEGYYQTLSIPLLSGRQFTRLDRSDRPRVAVINQTMAQRFWSGQDPLGKRFSGSPPAAGAATDWITVIGVCGGVRHTQLHEPPDAEVYFYYLQGTPASYSLVLRTQSDEAGLAPMLRQALASQDKELPLSRVAGMEQILRNATAPRRLTMLLLSLFAVLALILTAVGVYGVISYAVTRRTREMGIRMVFGAQPGKLLRLVMTQALLLALAGEIVGLLGALATQRLIASQVYSVSFWDPIAFGTVVPVLAAVIFLAGYLPARRVTGIDPLVALRHE